MQSKVPVLIIVTLFIMYNIVVQDYFLDADLNIEVAFPLLLIRTGKVNHKRANHFHGNLVIKRFMMKVPGQAVRVGTNTGLLHKLLPNQSFYGKSFSTVDPYRIKPPHPGQPARSTDVLIADGNTNHTHFLQGKCGLPHCEHHKCDKPCSQLEAFVTLAHATHKPPLGSDAVVLDSKDATGANKPQHAVYNNDPTKKVSASEVANSESNGGMEKNPLMDTFAKQAGIRDKIEAKACPAQEPENTKRHLNDDTDIN